MDKNIGLILIVVFVLVVIVGTLLFLKNKKEIVPFHADGDVVSEINLDDVESLSEMIDIMKSGRGDFEEGLTDSEVDEYQKQVNKEFGLEIPSDYVYFLKSMNNYYYGWLSCIYYLGKSDKSYFDIISETKDFLFDMNDWEIGKLQEKFIVLGRYNDGEGFIFYLNDSKKYLIVDCLTYAYLDDLTGLNTVDTFLEVLKYIGKDSNNYK